MNRAQRCNFTGELGSFLFDLLEIAPQRARMKEKTEKQPQGYHLKQSGHTANSYEQEQFQAHKRMQRYIWQQWNTSAECGFFIL